MKTWKLVAGILSIILFVVVTMQSCVVGIGNTLAENGETGGSGGIILAILMLAGGIVSAATRKSEGKGGNIALIVLFGLAALFGLANMGSYTDLGIWSAWCLVNAILAVVAMIKGNENKIAEQPDQQ